MLPNVDNGFVEILSNKNSKIWKPANIENDIFNVAKAIAPVFLPLIQSMGDLSSE